MIWDSHIHTEFSGDCDAPVNDVIRRAEELHLPGIIITDHLDLVYPEDPTLFLLDLEGYDKALRRLRDKTTGLPIRYGIEFGLAPGIGKDYEKIAQTYDYDFIIGSSHMVYGKDPYYPAFFEGRSVREAYEEYFFSILENIREWDGFDVYGHLDYVVRYCPEGSEPYRPADYLDIMEEILKELISRGKGIEINTAGFAYGLPEPHPARAIIARYRELGGEIITAGSDAHEIRNIACGFDKVAGILQAAGFRYYTLFKNRKPEFLPLS